MIINVTDIDITYLRIDETLGKTQASRNTWVPMNMRNKARMTPKGKYRIRGSRARPPGDLKVKQNVAFNDWLVPYEKLLVPFQSLQYLFTFSEPVSCHNPAL